MAGAGYKCISVSQYRTWYNQYSASQHNYYGRFADNEVWKDLYDDWLHKSVI